MDMVWQMVVEEEMRRRSEGTWRRVGARARAAHIRRGMDRDSSL
ncbi:MAG: hypothetical protein NVSMB48_23990 [Marmoricola sp.]